LAKIYKKGIKGRRLVSEKTETSRVLNAKKMTRNYYGLKKFEDRQLENKNARKESGQDFLLLGIES
jgi:hypothetical protein